MPTASFSKNKPDGPREPSSPEPAKEPLRTIHRRTDSHHGSTLRTLGHAAEYLAASEPSPLEHRDAGDPEAIHILMRLSREVFEEYVRMTQRHHSVIDWMMNQAIRIYGAA